jgi:hypothetical protein
MNSNDHRKLLPHSESFMPLDFLIRLFLELKQLLFSGQVQYRVNKFAFVEIYIEIPFCHVNSNDHRKRLPHYEKVFCLWIFSFVFF